MGIDSHWVILEGCKVKEVIETKKVRACDCKVDTALKHCSSCGSEIWRTKTIYPQEKFFTELEDNWHDRYRSWFKINGEGLEDIFIGNILLEISEQDYDSVKIAAQWNDIRTAGVTDDIGELSKFLKADGFEILDSGIFRVYYGS